jgi:superfamily II DNA or RNA helicase
VRVFALEKKPSLVLVRQINHGKQILDVLEQRSLKAGWITGKTPMQDREFQLEDLWAGNLDTIVAQAETIGEGVDLPPLRALINATGTRGGGSSKEEETGRTTIQFMGRGLRQEPGKLYFDYVDFVDLGHRSTKRASLDRIDTLEAEGYGAFIRYWSDYQSDDLRRVG